MTSKKNDASRIQVHINELEAVKYFLFSVVCHCVNPSSSYHMNTMNCRKIHLLLSKN